MPPMQFWFWNTISKFIENATFAINLRKSIIYELRRIRANKLLIGLENSRDRSFKTNTIRDDTIR